MAATAWSTGARARWPARSQPCAGAYAQVLQPGRVRVGDPVRLR
ncbi:MULTISPECIES: MOSC domain-containing protein [Streptomyces]